MAVFHFKESLMSALHKTFGSVEIKSLDEQKRTFKGVASTPNQDRAKDVMVPKGADFDLPMPLRPITPIFSLSLILNLILLIKILGPKLFSVTVISAII